MKVHVGKSVTRRRTGQVAVLILAFAAMGVIAETMVALMLTEAMLEKFGGDALTEMKRNFDGYQTQLRTRAPKGAAS